MCDLFSPVPLALPTPKDAKSPGKEKPQTVFSARCQMAPLTHRFQSIWKLPVHVALQKKFNWSFSASFYSHIQDKSHFIGNYF